MNDLISRKDAINYMANAIWHYPNYTALNVYENAEELAKYGLANVPSAESTGAMDEAIQNYINEGYMELDRPKGKWYTNRFRYDCTCSNCGCSVYHKDALNFCPKCGANMGE